MKRIKNFNQIIESNTSIHNINMNIMNEITISKSYDTILYFIENDLINDDQNNKDSYQKLLNVFSDLFYNNDNIITDYSGLKNLTIIFEKIIKKNIDINILRSKSLLVAFCEIYEHIEFRDKLFELLLTTNYKLTEVNYDIDSGDYEFVYSDFIEYLKIDDKRWKRFLLKIRAKKYNI